MEWALKWMRRLIASALAVLGESGSASNPPLGTSGALVHGGNSTPARSPVADFQKSPAFSPALAG